MKTEQLKELGLDSEQIKGVFKLNGLDIENVRSEFTNLEEKNEELQSEVDNLQAKIDSKSDTDIDHDEYERLLNVEEELNNQLISVKEEHDAELSELRYTHLLDSSLKGAGARSVKAVKALLNQEEIKLEDGKLLGFEESLEQVKKEHDYMFEGEDKIKTPNFIKPGNDSRDNVDNPFTKRLAKYK